ncbi:MAG: ATP-binding protein [Acidimicrobiales bacterium]
MPDSDVVRLVVPARPEFLRLARVTAAGLAARFGFVYDEVEDIRLGVDEICFAALGGQERDGTVEITFRVAPQVIVVEGAGSFSDSGEAPGLNDLSRLVLAAVADEHDVKVAAHHVEFRLVKRHSDRAASV